jgi:CRP/FNR family transcriptional regulator, cyclic AMP receptor protein
MNAYLTTRETDSTIAVESLPDQPLFRGMTESHRKIMAECSGRATFGEGKSVVETGSPNECFYLVVSGSIRLEALGARAASPLRTVGSGEILGWSWLFPPDCWQFDAIAIEPTEVIFFDATRLCRECNRDPGFGFELFKRLAHRRSRGDTNRRTKDKSIARSILGSRAADAVVCDTENEKLLRPIQNQSAHGWPHVLFDSARIAVKSFVTGLPYERISHEAK